MAITSEAAREKRRLYQLEYSAEKRKDPEYRERQKKYLEDYHKRRYADPALRERAREKSRAYYHARKGDPEFKAQRARHRRNHNEKRKQMRKDPEFMKKEAAHTYVRAAVFFGDLVKPDQCEDCGNVRKRIHAHHEDYDKPLDVVWLCTRCHGRRHRV